MRPFLSLTLAAALLASACAQPSGAAPVAAASAPGAAASPVAPAPARACASRAGASAVPRAPTSKARHVPDEGDPCADSTGATTKPQP